MVWDYFSLLLTDLYIVLTTQSPSKHIKERVKGSHENKGVAHSDEDTEKYHLNLLLPSAHCLPINNL